MNTRTDTRPNIVLLFPDQWRHDALSVLGHPVAETPFLDQIAHQGVRFTSAYSPAPTCISSLRVRRSQSSSQSLRSKPATNSTSPSLPIPLSRG